MLWFVLLESKALGPGYACDVCAFGASCADIDLSFVVLLVVLLVVRLALILSVSWRCILYVRMVWYCMGWHGMAWHGMAWYGMVR